MLNRIYMDNAATTPLAPEALAEMMPYFTECYGNASGVYGTGREAHQALDTARKRVAAAIGAEPREIYFTSGGSESDNWAIKGAALAGGNGKGHIITSVVEHHAVLHTCQWLEKLGFDITFLPVDGKGCVNPEEVRGAIREDTRLISIMTANNEIGTIQPISEIGRIAREHGILFHTDAVQALGAVPVDVNAMNVDLLSLSGHKFHGPKGVGALYIRRGTKLESLIHGGAQERSLRAGTENIPGIVGMGKVAELAVTSLSSRMKAVTALRNQLIQGIREAIPETILNGDPENRLPGNVHFSFPNVEGEALLMRMDLAGIACSGGSACTAGSSEPSHVLAAIGQDPVLSRSGLRLSLSDQNTMEEVREVICTLSEIVRDMRK